MKSKLYLVKIVSLLLVSINAHDIPSDYSVIESNAEDFACNKEQFDNIFLFHAQTQGTIKSLSSTFEDINSMYVEYILSEITPSIAQDLKNYYLSHPNRIYSFAQLYNNAHDEASFSIRALNSFAVLSDIKMDLALWHANPHQLASLHEEILKTCDENEKEQLLNSLNNRYNKFQIIS